MASPLAGEAVGVGVDSSLLAGVVVGAAPGIHNTWPATSWLGSVILLARSSAVKSTPYCCAISASHSPVSTVCCAEQPGGRCWLVGSWMGVRDGPGVMRIGVAISTGPSVSEAAAVEVPVEIPGVGVELVSLDAGVRLGPCRAAMASAVAVPAAAGSTVLEAVGMGTSTVTSTVAGGGSSNWAQPAAHASARPSPK